MANSLYNDIFVPVKKRIIERKESLSDLTKIQPSISFEGWLKIETVKALDDKVEKIKNRGLDLVLSGEHSGIELKASTVNINYGYFIDSNSEIYKAPILIIAGGNEEDLRELAHKHNVSVIGVEAINNDLILCLVDP